MYEMATILDSNIVEGNNSNNNSSYLLNAKPWAKDFFKYYII